LQNNFVNPQLKKFYFIRRAFKVTNIVITVIAVLIVTKHFLGI